MFHPHNGRDLFDSHTPRSHPTTTSLTPVLLSSIISRAHELAFLSPDKSETQIQREVLREYGVAERHIHMFRTEGEEPQSHLQHKRPKSSTTAFLSHSHCTSLPYHAEEVHLLDSASVTLPPSFCSSQPYQLGLESHTCTRVSAKRKRALEDH